MKTNNITISLMLFISLMLASCGGSTSENKILGKVPGYYMESSQLRKDFKEWARNKSDYREIQDKENDVKAGQQKLSEKAAEAAEDVINQEVPFDGGTVNPDFEVVNVIIESYNGKGCFTARAYVKAAREMQVMQYPSQIESGRQIAMVDTYLYYVLLTSDNTGIALGKINPFSDRPALGVSGSNVFELNPGDWVQAGENVNQLGSPIAINCEMYNLTDFAQIKFISAQDYRNLGGR